MNILTVSIVLFTLVIFYFTKGNKKTFLHPFFYISFYYLFFFYGQSTLYPDLSLDVDFAIMISYIFFTVAFFFIFTTVKNSFIDRQLKRFFPYRKINDFVVSLKDKNKTILIIFIIILIWTFLFFDLSYKENGESWQAVFLRFYSLHVNEYPLYHKFVYTLLPLMLALIFILRILTNYYKSKFSNIVSVISIFLIALCFFTIGTRGYFLKIMYVLILADLIYSHIENKKFRISFLTKFFLVSLILVMVMLTSIRKNKYTEYDDMFSDIQTSISGESVSRFSRGGSIPDDIAFSLKHYGNDKDFLGMHTYYSILVNPIPRIFWAEKPVGFGKILAWEKGAPKGTNISFAAGIAGEGYAGFGWLGIILLSLVIGSYSGFLAKVAMRCFQYRNFIVLSIGLLAFSCSIAIVRGDMLSAITMNIYTLIFFLIILYFRKIFLLTIKRK